MIEEDELSSDGTLSKSAYKTLIRKQRRRREAKLRRLAEGASRDRILYLWSRVRTVYIGIRFVDQLRKNK